MDKIIMVLLIIAAFKFLVFGWILYAVFKPDLEVLEEGARVQAATTPACIYCQSVWTRAVDEGQTRWEGDELVLVTTYQCEHCETPFWNVERVPVSRLPA